MDNERFHGIELNDEEGGHDNVRRKDKRSNRRNYRGSA